MINDVLDLKEIVIQKLREGSKVEDLASRYNLHVNLVKEWADGMVAVKPVASAPVSFEEQAQYLEQLALNASDFEEAQTVLAKVKAWQVIQTEKRAAASGDIGDSDSNLIRQIETKRC